MQYEAGGPFRASAASALGCHTSDGRINAPNNDRLADLRSNKPTLNGTHVKQIMPVAAHNVQKNPGGFWERSPSLRSTKLANGEVRCCLAEVWSKYTVRHA